MRMTRARAEVVLVAMAIVSAAVVSSGGAAVAAPSSSSDFRAAVILSGAALTHTFSDEGSASRRSEPLMDPDDITRLGQDLFVGFQNGVGPQGQASADGNRDSTIVELTMSGRRVGQWDVKGKADGVTADSATGLVIATVNEDANSSLYAIDPAAGTAKHYAYREPLPNFGGTDAISVDHGRLLISASAPGTTGAPAPQPTYPAVYSVTLDPTAPLAAVVPLFYDEDAATVANAGSHQTVALALTDPDSNEVVPSGASRFAGDFMVTSQGDEEQIYVRHPGAADQQLSVLSLSQSVDDTAWPTDRSGKLYSTDSTNDTVDVITGPFTNQPVVAATPCGANRAPATCPMPPNFPVNYLASLNSRTGEVTALTVIGAAYVPQGGLVFVPGS
jgi:hypothetical protein